MFTPVVRALQERYGSRRQYARLEAADRGSPRLGPEETEYLAERDSFYVATLGATGWPYVQHRGGPKGFLKVIDDQTLAFADFSGNKQFISAGNLMTDNRVALILMDYPRQLRLKILGRVEIIDGEKAGEWLKKVRDPEYRANAERVFVIRVEAFDWNCQQHILPRFTAEEIREVAAPLEKRLRELEVENSQLRQQLTRSSATNAAH
jgi:predicted pyridoxine 5'-phosphate oxidase superfamily flavin-nucleotide-binding protein